MVAHRAFALIGTVALASTLVACGGAPREVGADQSDQSHNDQAGDGKISISEINADNVAGICKQGFGDISDVYERLAIDVPSDATFGYTDDRYKEGGGWSDQYFPEDSFNEDDPGNATVRCDASTVYKDDSGKKINVSLLISITASEEGPRGNTDFTVEAGGMTAGILSYTRSGSGMDEEHEGELVEQSSGEKYLTDEVLTKFKP